MIYGPLAQECRVELHMEGIIVTEHAAGDIVTAAPPPLPRELLYRLEDLRAEVQAFPLMDKKPRRRGQRESIRSGFDKRGRRG